ncbi:MAG: hypothetical protein KatS3mg061_2151 [Dehalococcoidia bacterium]|nr:MAG: hypothetical protein KatS3mg061_2151 [Dehalococcoidia bacterium]
MEQEPKRHPFVPPPTGLEGREQELGWAVRALVRTLSDRTPYPHEFNDALVKSTLTHLEFCRQHGLVKEMQQHQVKTLEPVLRRVKMVMEKAGDPELALVGMFDRTACHYQLVKFTEVEPGVRRFPCPFRLVLEQGRRIGQYHMELADVHEQWCVATWQGYADYLGVKLEISPCDGGMVEVRLAQPALASATAAETAAAPASGS